MSTEPDFNAQKVLENDRLVEDQNEKTISVFDFTEPGQAKPFEEEKSSEEKEAAPEPKAWEATKTEPPKTPDAPRPEVSQSVETADSGKGKKILVIILTVVLALLGIFLAIVAGPLGLLALGGIPLLFIFVWPRKRKRQ